MVNQLLSISIVTCVYIYIVTGGPLLYTAYCNDIAVAVSRVYCNTFFFFGCKNLLPQCLLQHFALIIISLVAIATYCNKIDIATIYCCYNKYFCLQWKTIHKCKCKLKTTSELLRIFFFFLIQSCLGFNIVRLGNYH